MAALCPGVQYGLSSQENFGENKDLVFVKLTDSAYRAIEEYLRNQNKFSVKSPTIKFLGNEGQLCFPSGPPPSHQNGTGGGSGGGGNHGSNNASTTFKFSLSSTADMEGPGGSFECVQHHQTQAPRRALGALGAIPHKMRIHATDDVYEETRKRMTFAEKVHKNKCTREIKMNQTDIGRKVKVKQSSGSNSSRSSSSNRRDPPPSSSALPSSLSSSSNTSSNNPVLPPLGGSSSSNNIPTAATPKLSPYSSSSSSGFPTSSSSNSSNIGTTNGIHLGKNSSSSSNQSIPPLLNSGGLTAATSNNHRQQNGGGVTSGGGGLRSNHVSSSRPQKPSMQDVARRPLKERLIHLLALRPFKKIEIHERLNKEGLRERNGMSSVLKQISSLKDNCFYLNRAMWNEVNEDWPFYTESEKQMLKRRKPQNLTPPGGSDGGSSGSGNSPTSTHPGSPPPPMSMPMSTSGGGGGGKRPSNPAGHGAHYGDTIPGHPELPMGSLRQRISHLKQRTPEPNYHQRSPPVENNSQRRPMTDSRDASNMNPRSRETVNSGSNNNTGYHHSQSQSSQHHYGNGTSNNYQYPTQPAPPVGGGGGGHQQQQPQQQQQQQQPQQHQPTTNGYATNGNKRSFSGNLSDDDEMTTRKRPCDSHTLSFNVNREKSSSNSATPADHTTAQHDPISPKKQPANKSTDSSPRGGSNNRNSSSSTSGGRKSSEHSSMPPAVDTNADHSNNYYSNSSNSHRWNSSSSGGGGGGNTGATSGNVTSSTQGGRGGDSRVTTSSMMVTAARVSPDSQSDRIATMAVEQQQQQQEVKGGEGTAVVEGDGEKMELELDYQTEYVAIRDIEQRRRYKSMFYADYEEYKELHGVVEKVSQRFVELDERLKQETNTTSSRYKEIKKQILREYQMNKRDHAHQTAKRRFDYLHGKLSHIKQLVSDYDATMTPTVPPPLLGN